MEDFIYILIGIAWIAYTVYNQGQKQKQKQLQKPGNKPEDKVTVPTDRKESILDKKFNFESLFDLEEINTEYLDDPVSRLDVVTEEDETAFFEAENEGVSKFEEMLSTEPDSAVEIKVNPEEDKKELQFGCFEEDGSFDVRKAIIYSEILNPPYINLSARS